MKSQKSFTLTHPPMNVQLMMLVLASLAFIVVFYLTVSPPRYIVVDVVMTLMVILLVIFAILWVKMFRVKVSGTTITVRKGVGLTHFRFDVSEIEKVKWKAVEAKSGRTDKITIYTADHKKVPVETLMVNSDKMIAFLKQYVEASKIEKTYKSTV